MREDTNTIRFAPSTSADTRGLWVGMATSACAFLAILLSLNHTSIPWFDEVAFADTAINCVRGNGWVSHIWPYSYNPLHINLLTIWLRLFGASHFSVCAFGVSCALLTSLILQRALIRIGILKTTSQNILFATSFWFGSWQFSNIITNGRIDMLAAACTIMLVVELTAARYSPWRIFAAAFLAMLSAVYQIPLIVFFGLYLLAFPLRDETRHQVFLKGLVAAAGVFAAFIASCAYYTYHQSLIRFIHSYFSYNATLSGSTTSFTSRIAVAYCHDLCGLGLLLVTTVLLLLTRKQNTGIWRWIAFIAIMPLCGVIGGRYEGYYSWMFYLATLSCFLATITFISPKIVPLALMAIALIAGSRYVIQWPSWAKSLAKLHQIEKYVKAHPESFKPGQRVLISESLWYYPVLQSGATIWSDERFVGPEKLTAQEKFERFLGKNIANPQTRERMIRIFAYLQKPEDALVQPYFSAKSAEF